MKKKCCRPFKRSIMQKEQFVLWYCDTNSHPLEFKMWEYLRLWEFTSSGYKKKVLKKSP